MERITEKTIVDKGMDYVRKLQEFRVDGNHYIPYPSQLKSLHETYTSETDYFGPADQGSTITIFKRKTEEQILKERNDNDLKHQITIIEEKFKVKLKVV